MIIEYITEKFEQLSHNHLDVQEELEQNSRIAVSVILNWVQRIPEIKGWFAFSELSNFQDRFERILVFSLQASMDQIKAKTTKNHHLLLMAMAGSLILRPPADLNLDQELALESTLMI